jgi:hypothetical protein
MKEMVHDVKNGRIRGVVDVFDRTGHIFAHLREIRGRFAGPLETPGVRLQGILHIPHGVEEEARERAVCAQNRGCRAALGSGSGSGLGFRVRVRVRVRV